MFIWCQFLTYMWVNQHIFFQIFTLLFLAAGANIAENLTLQPQTLRPFQREKCLNQFLMLYLWSLGAMTPEITRKADISMSYKKDPPKRADTMYYKKYTIAYTWHANQEIRTHNYFNYTSIQANGPQQSAIPAPDPRSPGGARNRHRHAWRQCISKLQGFIMNEANMSSIRGGRWVSSRPQLTPSQQNSFSLTGAFDVLSLISTLSHFKPLKIKFAWRVPTTCAFSCCFSR